MTSNYVVYMMDGSDRVGQIEFSRLEVANRYLKRGRWELATNYLPGPLTWKSRIQVVRNGTVIFSGPFNRLDRKWTYAETNRREYTGYCDLTYLDHRMASPDPTLSTAPYNTQTADVRTGAAETVIRGFINANAGPGAVSSRQVPGLAVQTDSGRGSNVKGRARFADLMELCKGLAIAGHIGFEIVDLTLRFYVPQDLSTSVIFSEALDNVKEIEFHGSPPKFNHVIVLGGGTGTSRSVTELGDLVSITAHGRRELVVDARQTTDSTELYTRALSELTKNMAEDLNIHIIPGAAAIESMQPYDNVYLGDTVSVVIDGKRLMAQVQEIGVLESQEKVQEHVTLGNFGKHNRYVSTTDLLDIMNTRIRYLEAEQ